MSLQFNDEAIAGKFIELCENVSAIKTDMVNIKEDITEIKKIKKIVDKHEKAYAVGKYAAVPLYGMLHISVKHLLAKFGW